jgi:hypothetical protein
MELGQIEKHLQQQSYESLVHGASGLEALQRILPVKLWGQLYLGCVLQMIRSEMHMQERKQLDATFKVEDELTEAVDVIASGYEWTCPACKRWNMEIEHPVTVKCRKCEKEYITNPPEHAYGN